MTKEFITLKVKQIFTIKRISISLISLFFILFFVGGCSFRYMDWQYYKFLRLVENESGIYVYDRKLYEEVELLRKKNGGIYHFNLRLPDGSILYKGVLSNGYEIISSPSANKQDEITMRNSRIGEYNFIRYQYYDLNHKSHIIAKVKGFKYAYYGLWLDGDEGGGFDWKTKKVADYYLDNIFYIEDTTNDK